MSKPKTALRLERVDWSVRRVGERSGDPADPNPLRIEGEYRGPVRRIVRIALVGDPIASARTTLHGFADALTKGMSDSQRERLESNLRRIASGEDPNIVLGLRRSRHGTREPDRLVMLTLDYLLRSAVRPRLRKIAPSVATDWKERSVETVKQIRRRMQPLAREMLLAFLKSEMKRSDFNENLSGRLYMDAVRAARAEILTGEPEPIDKTPDEVIELTFDWFHVLRYYSQCE